MKHVIIGTAGHVDHGKTLLVKALRRREKPVIGRISQGRYLLDVRTLRDEELPDVEAAVKEALQ